MNKKKKTAKKTAKKKTASSGVSRSSFNKLKAEVETLNRRLGELRAESSRAMSTVHDMIASLRHRVDALDQPLTVPADDGAPSHQADQTEPAPENSPTQAEPADLSPSSTVDMFDSSVGDGDEEEPETGEGAPPYDAATATGMYDRYEG